jgi:hypothetical protein
MASVSLAERYSIVALRQGDRLSSLQQHADDASAMGLKICATSEAL